MSTTPSAIESVSKPSTKAKVAVTTNADTGQAVGDNAATPVNQNVMAVSNLSALPTPNGSFHATAASASPDSDAATYTTARQTNQTAVQIATANAPTLTQTKGVPNPEGLPTWRGYVRTPANYEKPEDRRQREQDEIENGERKRKRPNLGGSSVCVRDRDRKDKPYRGR